MSVSAHRERAARHVSCAVLTISDTRTLDTDLGGRAIVELLESAGHTIVQRAVVPDDPRRVEDAIKVVVKARGVSAAHKVAAE